MKKIYYIICLSVFLTSLSFSQGKHHDYFTYTNLCNIKIEIRDSLVSFENNGLLLKGKLRKLKTDKNYEVYSGKTIICILGLIDNEAFIVNQQYTFECEDASLFLYFQLIKVV